MKINALDKVFALLLFALGLYIALSASSYGYRQHGNPGPGFFPFWVGSFIAGLSIVNFVRSVAGKEKLENEIEVPGLLKSLGIGAALIVFVFVSDYLGMVLSCGVLVLVIGWIIRPKWDRIFTAKIVATAILFPLAGCLIFGTYLSVPLPVGLFGL